MSEGLALDHASFEKLLEAASVLQRLHDELHGQEVSLDQVATGVFEPPHPMCAENPGLPATVATVGASKPVPVLEKQATADEAANVKEQPRPAFNPPVADLRSAFRRALKAFGSHRPAFGVNFTPRGLRTVAIAATMLLLTLAAAPLLLEAWRHAPLHKAEALPIASPVAGAVADKNSTNLTTATSIASAQNKNTAIKKPEPPTEILASGASHRQVTDPSTLSVLRELSRYEIRGLRRRAKYGDASAAFTLGMAYETGRYVPRNCRQAARWVLRSADAGNAAAQYNLGLRYRDGDGVSANRAESRKWLRRAAARRYSKSKLALQMVASR
jgi:hypothetical protein